MDHTTEGILMWSEPYFLDLDDKTNIAMLLMYTEGTFNPNDSVRQNTVVFAISTLLSSVPIFNTCGKITSQEIDGLLSLTSYAGGYNLDKGKPFQCLVYLIRDYTHGPQEGYGDKAGAKYWKMFEGNSQTSSLAEWFESFSCYTMPTPNDEVKMSTFNGNLNELTKPIFRDQIQYFTECMFKSENLHVKKSLGRKLRSEGIIQLFKDLENSFRFRKIPSPINILESMIVSGFNDLKNEVLDNIDELFNFFWKNKTPDGLFEWKKKMHTMGLVMFRNNWIVKENSLKEKYEIFLDNEICKKNRKLYDSNFG
jgi:atlastin